LLPLLYLGALLGAGMPDDSLAAGLQALDHKDYQQAQQIFQSLVTADPKDYSAYFNLALAEIGLKKDDQAAGHFKQVLELKPGLYEAELNLGVLEVRRQHPGDAVVPLRDAVKQRPDQARPQRYLGDALLESGDPAGAAEAYRGALAADPKLAAAELGWGQSLLKQDKLDEARAHFNQAVALDPNLKSYLLQMAGAFEKAKRPEQAIELLAQFPDDPGAREELGRIYLETNRPADAVSQFQAAVKLSPTSANQLALATAYLRNKQTDAAVPILEQALASNPNDYDLHMAVGRIHRDRREFPIAANQFLAAAKLKPDSAEAWNEAASVLMVAEQYPQALAALDQVRSLNAEIPGDIYYRAIALDKLHQVKPALQSYRRFLEASQGKLPDQEFIARQRSRILEKEAGR
jgi:tetratricopeptide (TPR) repeat protein